MKNIWVTEYPQEHLHEYMRVGALYNAKHFTDAHSLDDEHYEVFWLHEKSTVQLQEFY